MTFLLDVNVLIALLDPGHIHHDHAHNWFATQGQASWATCPLTENAVLRILGQPRYPNSPGTPAVVTGMLKAMCRLRGHVFWADDISVRESEVLDTDRLLSSGQVTDSYLLALACAHGGQLATFDRRLVTDAVQGGVTGLCILG